MPPPPPSLGLGLSLASIPLAGMGGGIIFLALVIDDEPVFMMDEDETFFFTIRPI